MSCEGRVRHTVPGVSLVAMFSSKALVGFQGDCENGRRVCLLQLPPPKRRLEYEARNGQE